MAMLVKSLQAFRAEANARYPNRDKTSDGWIGDTAHQDRTSDHNPDDRGYVHAYDLDEDVDGNPTDSGAELGFLAEHIRARRDPRVKYVIYEGRIFAGGGGPKPWEWRPYTGISPHKFHMHVSVLSTFIGENDVSPWFPEDDLPTPAEVWAHPIESKIDGNPRPAQEVLAWAQAQAQSADSKADSLAGRLEALEQILLQVPAAVWDHLIYEQVSGEERLARQMINGAHYWAYVGVNGVPAPAPTDDEPEA